MSMVMWFLFVYLFATVANSDVCDEINDNDKTIVNIFALTTIKQYDQGKDNVGAQKLALKQINDNSSIFSEYEFDITVLDAQGETVNALKHALDVIKFEGNLVVCQNNETGFVTKAHLPYVLGAPWSSFSVMSAPALNGFNFGMLSVTATSVLLSNDNDFPYFTRMPPSDSLQAAAIIALCQEFEWDKIVVLYVNNIYGVYLTTNILSAALENEQNGGIAIETFSISYEESDNDSYTAAATAIKELEVYIIVMITYEEFLGGLTPILRDEGLLDYPYFYIGDSVWIDEAVLTGDASYGMNYQGALGMTFNLSSLNPDEFVDMPQSLRNEFAESESLASKFQGIWNEQYSIDPDFLYNISQPNIWAPYAWDSITVLKNSLQLFDNVHGLQAIWNGSMDQSVVIKSLYELQINFTNFVGTTGRVSMATNGDRANEDGKLYSAGYCYYDSNDNLVYAINRDGIIWPNTFSDRGIIPSSQKLITPKYHVINSTLFVVMNFLLGISAAIVLICIIITILHRNDKIIKAASYKLNVLSLLGAIVLYAGSLLFGIDRSHGLSESSLDGLCNIRIWLVIISVSLLFMPLFYKTYRIARIFEKSMITVSEVQVKDEKLMFYVLVHICVDVILLTIFRSISPFYISYKISKTTEEDALQFTEYKYGVCTSDHDLVFISIMAVWKLAQLLFGCYVAVILAKLVKFDIIARFDETGSQAFSIFCCLFVASVIIPMMLFLDESAIDVHFFLISLLAVIIGNVLIVFNFIPRLRAIFQHKQEKFLKTPQENLEKKWLKKIYKITQHAGREKGYFDSKGNSVTREETVSDSEDSKNNHNHHNNNKKHRNKKDSNSNHGRNSGRMHNQVTPMAIPSQTGHDRDSSILHDTLFLGDHHDEYEHTLSPNISVKKLKFDNSNSKIKKRNGKKKGVMEKVASVSAIVTPQTNSILAQTSMADSETETEKNCDRGISSGSEDIVEIDVVQNNEKNANDNTDNSNNKSNENTREKTKDDNSNENGNVNDNGNDLQDNSGKEIDKIHLKEFDNTIAPAITEETPSTSPRMPADVEAQL